MKHLLLLTTLMGALLFTSCDPGSDSSYEAGTYPDTACFATVSIEPSVDSSESDRYIFVTDKGIRLLLVDNQTTTKYEPYDGERVVIQFYTTDDYTPLTTTEGEGDGEGEGNGEGEGEGSTDENYNCSYGIRLFYITHVYKSESVVVETEEQDELYAEHAISYIYDSLVYSDGYINMIAGLRADNLDNIKLYLVENKFEEPTQSVDGYLNLELRYDRGTDEAYGATYEEYVSLDLSDHLEQIAQMDGVLLKVITLQSGTFYIKMDIDVDSSESKALDKVQSSRSKASNQI